MTHYNLIKLAEDNERKRNAVLSHITPSVGLGAGFLGAGTMLASGHDSVFNKGNRDRGIKMLEGLKKDKQIAEIKSKMHPSIADDVKSDFARTVYEYGDVRKNAKKTYNNQSTLERLLAGRMELKDTDDPAELLQRIGKRKNLLNRAGYATGATALGYGAYRHFNKDKK